MESTRRGFLREFFIRRAVAAAAEIQKAFKEAESDAEYFRSFENSYPLISEYMMFMDEEAKALGIETNDKKNHEVAEEIYLKSRKSS